MYNLRSLPTRFPWLAWAVLAVGLLLAVAIYFYLRHEQESDARRAFAAQADDISDSVLLRVRAYGDVLYALRGLFNSSNAVTRDEFRRFVTGLGIHERYPGLLNVSYAHFVPGAKKAEFERQVRRESGFSDFAINPPGDRPEYHVLVFFEPQEGRRPSFGLDLASDPPRREVVERARDTAQIATSEPITLLRDKGSRESSVLLRLAIYRDGAAAHGPADRRRNYQGVVGAAINVRQLMQAALGKGQFQRARLQIYDGGPAGAGRGGPGAPLFDSHDLLAKAPAKPGGASLSRYTAVRRLVIGDRAWQLHVTPRRNPARAADQVLPIAAAIVVATIALLLFGLVRALAVAEAQATHDKLTGLNNRHYMHEWLERELKRATRHGRPLGAIMMDLDHFKRINDEYGHGAGDQVLREVAAALKRSSRQSDIACRYGGEEFLLLMPESPLEATVRRAEQLRGEIAKLDLAYQKRPLGRVTLSAGIAVFPEHGADQDTLLRNADAALYRAKQGGRDRVATAQQGQAAV
jgi:diguanylate cyclase (GGDEF)-like protein